MEGNVDMKLEIDLHSETADELIRASLKEHLDGVYFWKDEPEYQKKLEESLKVVLEYYGG